MPPFERIHHRRIVRVLESLDADLLRADHCWFGGGTAIALTHGECAPGAKFAALNLR